MAGGACPKAAQASTAAAIGTGGEATRTVVMLAGIAAGTFIGIGDMTAVIAGDPLPLIELDIGTLRIVIGQHRAYEQEDFSQASVFQTLDQSTGCITRTEFSFSHMRVGDLIVEVGHIGFLRIDTQTCQRLLLSPVFPIEPNRKRT